MPLMCRLAFAVLLAVLPKLAHGHNWMNNPPSRTLKLSKQAPCPSRPADSYHISTTPGADFWLEWAIGHTGFTYVIIVKAEHEKELVKVGNRMLNEYIDGNDQQFLTGAKYDKRHVRGVGCDGSCRGVANEAADPSTDSKLVREVQGSDFGFTRDKEWRCAKNPPKNGCGKTQLHYYEYTSELLTPDKRRAYTNNKYPWIVAAGKYKHVYSRAQDHDLVAFQLPPGQEPGDYVVQYLWNGYRDCMDMRVSAGTAIRLVTQRLWLKFDHCQFKLMQPNGDTPCQVLPSNGDVTACQTSCNNKNRCEAINVVPFRNPSEVYFQEARNIPQDVQSCKFDDLKREIERTDGVTEDTAQICYGFRAGLWPDVGTPYTITDDIEDPAFYSTCFWYAEIPRLNDSSAVPPPPFQYKFSGKCMDCAKAEAVHRTPQTQAPRWEFTDTCVPCAAPSS